CYQLQEKNLLQIFGWSLVLTEGRLRLVLHSPSPPSCLRFWTLTVADNDETCDNNKTYTRVCFFKKANQKRRKTHEYILVHFL
ncbi:mCG1038772, partial [Mus musculus]